MRGRLGLCRWLRVDPYVLLHLVPPPFLLSSFDLLPAALCGASPVLSIVHRPLFPRLFTHVVYAFKPLAAVFSSCFPSFLPSRLYACICLTKSLDSRATSSSMLYIRFLLILFVSCLRWRRHTRCYTSHPYNNVHLYHTVSSTLLIAHYAAACYYSHMHSGAPSGLAFLCSYLHYCRSLYLEGLVDESRFWRRWKRFGVNSNGGALHMLESAASWLVTLFCLMAPSCGVP